MTEEQEQLPAQQTQDRQRRCPTCAASPRLTFQFLDSRRGKTVRLYECKCGERIWDD
jgi:hypothetical protein